MSGAVVVPGLELTPTNRSDRVGQFNGSLGSRGELTRSHIGNEDSASSRNRSTSEQLPVRRRQVLGLALLGAGTWLLVACGGATQQATPASAPAAVVEPATQPASLRRLETLKISQPTVSSSQLAYYAAIKNGFFKDEGFDIETINMSADLAAAAAQKDEIDFALGTGSAVRLAVTGAPIKTVLVGQYKNVYYVVGRPEIHRLQDLQGETVAVPQGQPDISFRYVVQRESLTDVGIMYMNDMNGMVSALENGAVTAVVTPPPFNIYLRHKGMSELLFLGDATPLQVGGGLATSESRISRNPDQVKRAVRAYVKGVRSLSEDKTQGVQIVADELKLPNDVAESVLEIFLKGVSPNGLAPDEAFQGIIDDQRRAAQITEAVPVSQVRDFTILRQALNELGIPES
jgi:ABC-type nitrate/sulfonate/bicarbonate transport system substrate-binding protein